ncbi:atrial natriuretic peptide clearance receptor-like protein [Euroglyphus maynei]|uniref:Atrial natriuretic peptide clearance receptor-like protein n=1 Tax=Euroglyphus maynei TaxID=6958 RepID=A0A1Y3ARC0_EURMA|nr:atrial natriuretic peptide clearance receptor-like protein [Euroglyphus maynei]
MFLLISLLLLILSSSSSSSSASIPSSLLASTSSTSIQSFSGQTNSKFFLIFFIVINLFDTNIIHAYKWTLVKDVDFLDTNYLMRWHPGRHPHQHLNDTFLLSNTAITNNENDNQDLLGTKNSRPIRIVVLAPYGSDEQYSLDKIMPAIIAAVKSIEDEVRINKYKYLGWEHGAEIYFVDTQCSSAIGPLAAFHYYIRGKVDVFLGPVCPYVLAPVARYTSYWDIPHLTSSGQVSMFDDKNSTFRILTRMNGSFSQ